MSEAPADGFALSAGGAEWRYHGSLTFENAASVYAASTELPLPTAGRVDLAEVTQVDSSALAVMLAVMRRARGSGQTLTLANVPAASATLARVYGVGELFTLECDGATERA